MQMVTFSLWLHGDDLAGVPAARGRHRHHPDAVLPVLVQVGHASEVHIRGRFELTDDLQRNQEHINEKPWTLNPLRQRRHMLRNIFQITSVNRAQSENDCLCFTEVKPSYCAKFFSSYFALNHLAGEKILISLSFTDRLQSA